jgi:hypothetical protein
MEEKQEALSIIDAYIERLQNIKNNIDHEIEGQYFNLTTTGTALEWAAMNLFRKYHRKDKYEDDN